MKKEVKRKPNQFEEMRFSKSDTIKLWSDFAVLLNQKRNRTTKIRLEKRTFKREHCWPWIDHWGMNVHGRELCYVYISYLFYCYLYETKTKKIRKIQEQKTSKMKGWVWYQGTTESSFLTKETTPCNTLLYLAVSVKKSVCFFNISLVIAATQNNSILETNEDESPGEEKQNLDDHVTFSKTWINNMYIYKNQNTIRQRRRRRRNFKKRRKERTPQWLQFVWKLTERDLRTHVYMYFWSNDRM